MSKEVPWWEQLDPIHPYIDFPYCTRPDMKKFITGHIDCIIDDFLYLSDLEGSERINTVGITCVISLLNKNMMIHTPTVNRHLKICLSDSETASLVDIIPMTTSFIDKCRDNNLKVLVHCSAGISRSSSIVIAYLMYSKQMTLEEAYLYVREKRPVISPNYGFLKQLNILRF